MWKDLYDSAWWLPILPSVGALAVLVCVLGPWRPALPRFVRAFALVCAALTALDAWCASWLHLPGGWSTAAAVTFVVLGDLRYFVAQGWWRRTRVWPWRALGWSLLVPIATQLVVRLPFPEVPERVLFLSYELAMLLVVSVHARLERGCRSLVRFELAQYAAWALADVLLLARLEPAYLLRIAANLAYYVAFVPYAVWQLRTRPADTP